MVKLDGQNQKIDIIQFGQVQHEHTLMAIISHFSLCKRHRLSPDEYTRVVPKVSLQGLLLQEQNLFGRNSVDCVP